MRSLIAALFFACAARVLGQTQVVDLFYDAHDNATVGTNVDATVLTAGSRKNNASDTWTVSFTNAAFMQVSNVLTSAPYYKFSVNNVTYTGSTTRCLRIDHTYDTSDAIMTLAAAKTAVSVGFFLSTTLINVTASTIQVDYNVLKTNTGKNVYSNFINSTMVLREETTISASSTFTSAAWFVPNTTYWVTMKYDAGAGPTAYLSVYNASTWQLVGVAVSQGSDAAANVLSWTLGQDRAGTLAGFYSYISNMVMDYTSATYPLGVPQTPGQPTSLSASNATATTVDLSWTNVDTKFQTIQILAAVHGGTLALVGSTNSDSASTYTVSGLRPGVQYDFAVRGHNIVYDGANSSTVSATTTAPTTQTVANQLLKSIP